MKITVTKIFFAYATLTLVSCALLYAQTANRSASAASDLPRGYWRLEQSQPIIEKTQTIRLAPDLSSLTAGERAAVGKLLEVGKIFQQIYEEQLHAQAAASFEKLTKLDAQLGSPIVTKNLLTLYRLNQGPIANTLENKREAFLPVLPRQEGSNMYPLGVRREQLDAYLAAHPEKRDSILDLRSVVRRADRPSLLRDIR
jgi:hypothetical protein